MPQKRLNTLQVFFDLAADIFITTDDKFRVTSVNPTTEHILGYSAEEMLGRPLLEFNHPDDVESATDVGHQAFAGREIFQYNSRLITKGGETRWIRWHVRIYDGQLFAIGTDITAERQATLKVQEMNRLLSNALTLEREWRAMAEAQQQRFRDLFNQMPMIAVVLSGPEHTIELANPSFYQLINFRNIMGCKIEEAIPLIDDVTLVTLKRVYTTGERFVGRNYLIKADWAKTGVATEKSFHVIFEPIITPAREVEAIWCLAFDVSETVQLENKLRSAERMSSLGEMAAGIGHEINNPLAYSLLNLDLLTDRLGSNFGSRDEIPAPIYDLVRKSIEGLDRVRDIVKGLKAFSRQDESSIEALDVTEPLNAALDFTSNELRHRAQLITEFDKVPLVLANSGRLTQVFTNLLVNAAHAVELGKANENAICVRVKKAESNEVHIEVQDSGCGIPADQISRVFEPFFTSKPVGVGTGLGLSICHGIVTSFGGEIEIESEVGKGTLVRVILPATVGQPTKQSTERLDFQTVCSRKRVLVIDDDKALRDVIQTALERDHDVTSVESAIEALHRLDDAREPFDWVICDVMMPVMTGMEFYETIRARGAGEEAKIILMTGGAFTPKVRAWMETLPNAKLDKPFRMKQLKELLEKTTSSHSVVSELS